MWNTAAVTVAPTSWDPVWEGGAAYAGKISVYDSSIYIADAAIHLMATKPELGIKDPYQLNDEQFAAAIALLEMQRDNGAVYWGTAADQITYSERGNLQGAQFFAVAGKVYEAAKRMGLGREIPTEWFLQDIRN